MTASETKAPPAAAPARANYGIDAPPAVLALAIGAAAGLAMAAIGALAIRPRDPELGHSLVSVGLRLGLGWGAGTLIMIWGSKRGKLGLRDRLLDGLALRGDERVLDVGCGRGLLLVGAAKRLARGRAVGVDIWQWRDQSGNGPAAALANARAEGVSGRVAVTTGDMRALPFQSDSFDAIVSSFAIHNVPRAAGRAKALAEIARVLKPGGQLALLDIRNVRAYARVLRDDLGMGDVAVSRLNFLPARVVTARKPAN
jgi:SAM-dependent methyltransferase